MDHPVIEDMIDWHGCDAVEFNPQKLGGAPPSATAAWTPTAS